MITEEEQLNDDGHRRPRWALRGVTVLFIALVVAVGVLGVALTSVAGALLDGGLAAERGQTRLLDGDLQAAEVAFVDARQAFDEAGETMEAPVVRTFTRVPLVGSNLRALRAIADAGSALTAAGRIVARADTGVSGGIAALAPRGGVIPTEQLAALAEPAAAATAQVEVAAARIDGIDPRWLLSPIDSARARLAHRVDAVREPARAAAALTEALPAFLGADGERRYFFGAGNPAELRGVGGFLGAYAILTADEGELTFSEFAPVQSLTDLPPDLVDPPHPDYATRYADYGGTGFWHNLNMTPDFPMAATAIRRLYTATEGERLDGVIVATPHALARMLELLGSATVPEVGTVTSEDVVEQVAIAARDEFESEGVRKSVLGEVAAGVVGRFLGGEGVDDPVAAGRILAAAVQDGDLLIHATDPEVQDGFATAGIAGELGGDGGDYFSVAGTAAGAYKLDYYVERSVRYDAVLRPDGSARSSARIELRNTAPTTGYPDTTIGPGRDDLVAGEIATIMAAYCAPGCLLMDYLHDDEPAPRRTETELDHPVFTSVLNAKSGETATVGYRFHTPEVWERTAAGGSYRFTFHDQTTIRDTELKFTVALPDGFEVVRASHDMTEGEGLLTWSGTPRAAEVFEVNFRRPFSGMVRDRISSLLGRAGARG